MKSCNVKKVKIEKVDPQVDVVIPCRVADFRLVAELSDSDAYLVGYVIGRLSLAQDIPPGTMATVVGREDGYATVRVLYPARDVSVPPAPGHRAYMAYCAGGPGWWEGAGDGA
jgi:hypothetical protein